MKAILMQRIDTLWGNACEIRVESELDNAHTLTVKEMGSLMIGTVMNLCEEVRSENDRWARARPDEETAAPPGTQTGREDQRYREMEAEREQRE